MLASYEIDYVQWEKKMALLWERGQLLPTLRSGQLVSGWPVPSVKDSRPLFNL